MAPLTPDSGSNSPAIGSNPSATMTDPLSALHDIHLPEPVSAWPPAPGWWILAVLLLALIAYATYRVLRQRRRNRYRQLALQELAQIQSRAETEAEQAAQHIPVAAINQLLKRVALLVFPYGATAQLSGNAWAEFLAAQCPALDAADFALLSEGPYQNPSHTQPPTAAAVTQLINATRRWIKHHRAPQHAALTKHHRPSPQRGQR